MDTLSCVWQIKPSLAIRNQPEAGMRSGLRTRSPRSAYLNTSITDSLDTNSAEEIGNSIHQLPTSCFRTIGQKLRTNDQSRFWPLYIHSCVDANESRRVAGKEERTRICSEIKVLLHSCSERR